MANAIQHVAGHFENQDDAAEHFGRSSAWLSQATAAANPLSKISALFDSGKIASIGRAVLLGKLAQKNEVQAGLLIDQVEQLPEGKKLARKTVNTALSEAGGRRRKKDEAVPVAGEKSGESLAAAPQVAPPPVPVIRQRVNPGKVRMVADLLGLDDLDEEEILMRLIDEFLALKGEASP